MARWIEESLLSHCDSLRGFHLLRRPPLRGYSDVDSWSGRTRGMALGSFADWDHAGDPVPDEAQRGCPCGTPPDLGRHRFCLLAMGDNADICRQWSARRP